MVAFRAVAFRVCAAVQMCTNAMDVQIGHANGILRAVPGSQHGCGGRDAMAVEALPWALLNTSKPNPPKSVQRSARLLLHQHKHVQLLPCSSAGWR